MCIFELLSSQNGIVAFPHILVDIWFQLMSHSLKTVLFFVEYQLSFLVCKLDDSFLTYTIIHYIPPTPIATAFKFFEQTYCRRPHVSKKDILKNTQPLSLPVLMGSANDPKLLYAKVDILLLIIFHLVCLLVFCHIFLNSLSLAYILFLFLNLF